MSANNNDERRPAPASSGVPMQKLDHGKLIEALRELGVDFYTEPKKARLIADACDGFSALLSEHSVLTEDLAVMAQHANALSDKYRAEIEALRSSNERMRKALEEIRRGYGVNHTSKWARDHATQVLSGLGGGDQAEDEEGEYVEPEMMARADQRALDAITKAQTAEPKAGDQGAAQCQGWAPTHRHLKRGTTYQVVAEGLLQTAVSRGAWDDLPVTIYRGEDGAWWARPTAEFNDGRFEALPSPPEQGEG